MAAGRRERLALSSCLANPQARKLRVHCYGGLCGQARAQRDRPRDDSSNYWPEGRKRWRIFSRTPGSFCATSRIESYSSTDSP
jgi:hypothetical protein